MKIIRSKLFHWTLTGLVLLIILRAGWHLVPQCTLLPNFASPFLSLAVLLAITYRIVNAYGWTLVLRSLRQNVDGSKATRIWIEAESRRWLPGGVWGYASRATRATELKVSRSVASASMLIELVLTVVASIIVFLPALFFYHRQLAASCESLEAFSGHLWTIGIALAGIAFGVWLVRRRLAEKMNSIFQKLALLKGLSVEPAKLAVALQFYVAMGFLNGLITACLIWSIPLQDYPPFWMVVAATSFSWAVGFFALFAPGGLVVRETAFALCLVFWIPNTTGLAVAVLARIVQIGAEFAGILWVGLASKRNAQAPRLVTVTGKLG